jgi:uncharacterized protein (TIGR03437 family)
VAQIPAVQGVVNSASFNPGEALSPGSMISIFGSNLSTSTARANVLPLPATLGGAQVTFGSTPAPLLYVSAGQINALIPWGLPADTASMTVTVASASSVPTTLAIGPSNPGIFASGGNAIAVVLGPDGQSKGLMSSTNAAQPGDIVEVYATGLGAVTNPPVAGAAPGSVLAYAALPVVASIGGVAANVMFAGLAPGFAGLFQVNVVVPQTFCATCGVSGAGTSPAGAVVSVPLQLFAGSGASNVAMLDLANPAAPPAPSLASLSPSSASPGSDLEISGTFTANAVTAVRFAMAGQTMDVAPVSVQAGSIDVLVPPFWNSASGAFAAAVGTVEVIQTVGGQALASNPSAFTIQNLPQLTGKPGQFTASALLLIEETMQQLAASLSFAQNSAITPANDGARTSLQSFATSTETFRQAILKASANPSAPTTLAIVDGRAAQADAAFLTNTDQLITAPYLGAASGSTTEPALRAQAAIGPGSCGDIAAGQLLQATNGSTSSSPVTDSTQEENCWASGVSQWMDQFVEFEGKIASWGTLLTPAAPAAVGAEAPSLLAALAAFQLYAGTIGQSVAMLMFSSAPASPGAASGISAALQSMEKLWSDWALDQSIAGALNHLKEDSGDLYDWGKALYTVWPDLKSVATGMLGPWVATAAGAPSLSSPVPVPSTLVSGVALDPNGNPIPDAQVTVLANPPSSQSPTATFPDGSYVLCIPTSGIGPIYPSNNTLSIQSGSYSNKQSLDLTKGSQTVNLTLLPTCTSCYSTYNSAANACNTGTLIQQSQCVNAALAALMQCLDACWN